jgi:hypothetical protein
VVELEGLAAAWAVERCKFYLDSPSAFTLVTDCKPLETLFNNKCLDQIKNDRLLKIKMSLARFTFTTRWVTGSKHLAADVLSHHPVDRPGAGNFTVADDDSADRDFLVSAVVVACLAPDQETSSCGPSGTPRPQTQWQTRPWHTSGLGGWAGGRTSAQGQRNYTNTGWT